MFFQFLLEGGHRSVGAEFKWEGVPDGCVVGVEFSGAELGFSVLGVLVGVRDVVLLLERVSGVVFVYLCYPEVVVVVFWSVVLVCVWMKGCSSMQTLRT